MSGISIWYSERCSPGRLAFKVGSNTFLILAFIALIALLRPYLNSFYCFYILFIAFECDDIFMKSSPLLFRCVSLSEAKVLKKPEGNNGIAPLLQVFRVISKSTLGNFSVSEIPLSETLFTESWHEREVFLPFTHGVCQVNKLS